MKKGEKWQKERKKQKKKKNTTKYKNELLAIKKNKNRKTNYFFSENISQQKRSG